jgi:hypothetical protein
MPFVKAKHFTPMQRSLLHDYTSVVPDLNLCLSVSGADGLQNVRCYVKDVRHYLSVYLLNATSFVKAGAVNLLNSESHCTYY